MVPRQVMTMLIGLLHTTQDYTTVTYTAYGNITIYQFKLRHIRHNAQEKHNKVGNLSTPGGSEYQSQLNH